MAEKQDRSKGLARSRRKSKAARSSNYGYAYSRRTRGGICDEMSFSYAEACKMLRTKLSLIVSDRLIERNDELQTIRRRCKILGITSAVQGEGKSTTTINLAYTMAEAGNRVCILETDMRVPTLGKYLSLKRTPGLSNLLSGQCSVQEALQKYESKKGVQFYIVTSGDVPPLPSELLESANMQELLTAFSEKFDYILLDLPPVTVVTDALTAAQYTDGMLLIVRQNYSDKTSLRDAINQFEVTGTKLLGVVFNGADGPSGKVTHKQRGKNDYRNSI